MTNKFASFAVTAAIILLTSCQKEAGQEPGTDPTTSSNRVKTYTESLTTGGDSYSASFNLSYDNNGRLSSMVSAASAGDKFVFAYPSNSMYIMELFNQNQLSIHEEFYLNSDGLVDSTYQYNDTDDRRAEKYSYNSGKQLVNMKEYELPTAGNGVLVNTTSYNYDGSGNLVQTSATNGEERQYEYFPDMKYILPIISGPGFSLPNMKVSLIKKQTVSVGGIELGTIDYTYTFDDKQRVSTETEVLSDGSILTRTYTYF